MNPMENEAFDRELQKKFNDFKPEISAGLWDKIATQLDARDKRNLAPMKGGRRFPAWWTTVAASILIVCGITYWYNRPVKVTYLHGRAAVEGESTAPSPVDLPIQDAAPAAEPLDIERLKRVFAKKDRKTDGNAPLRPTTAETAEQSIEVKTSGLLAANNEPAPPVKLVKTAEAEAARLPEQQVLPEKLPLLEETLVNVPDIQPLVAVEGEEETMLASATQIKQPFGVSIILNYVVGAVDQREEKLITFSNDDEGSLKLDFNFNIAKTKKRKVK
ncbi:hypothetical protein ACFOET_21170 [Parapedobacter deserti]|uniref:Uncharacterized protein n=1 Tax=Parapedobacter deserti TaxID=1912957 RepID=A0ABV7JQ66_9SPHI